MASISLRVNIVKLGTVKTLKFAGSMGVNEVCKDIREKLGEETGGADHGLFWPDTGKWLDARRTLDYYDLKSGDLLEYKKKHRTLRVKMMDETVKTVLVDDSNTVHELVIAVAQKIGISNPEEYSFTTEKLEEAAKMSAVKKTSDPKAVVKSDTQWLIPEKALREQGVEESELVVLKKKFFFSDQNIDRNDPIQLNLLYVQSQSAIVKGTHPCTLEEAAQFGALQCQIMFGTHEPDKHKPGFIKLAEFVPPEHVRHGKDLEAKIFQEHRKLQGMSELNAKFRYVQLCRSLKTYGVTFFLIKEKVPKKNKMIDVLLGVTRDSVMRLDADTKEVLKIWPLTTLRRWAATPTTFTLDFGDYADSYYSVQTTEGDAISQLIGGYIDIILKRKKDAERMIAEGDSELAIMEENIIPGRASSAGIVQGRGGQAVQSNVGQAGVVSRAQAGSAAMVGSSAQRAVMSGSPSQQANLSQAGLSPAQQSTLQTINNGAAAANAASSDLGVATSLPPLGNDPASQQWRAQTLEVNKQNIASQIAVQLACTTALANLTSMEPDVMDLTAISGHVSTVGSNLTQLTSGVKMAAALLEDRALSDLLLEAARKLAAATSKLLTNANGAVTGQGNRQEFVASAQSIATAGSQMLKTLGEPEVPLPAQQELVELAKQVAATMTETITQSKSVAGKTPDPKNRQDIISATKSAASAAALVVTASTLVAPTINSPVCQDQLLEAARVVETALGGLVSKSKLGCNDAQEIGKLTAAADRVTLAVGRLADKTRQGGQKDADLSDVDRSAEQVVGDAQAFLDCIGDITSVVAAARTLAVSSTHLVNTIKTQAAGENDGVEKARLLAAARGLAEATARMVNAAKEAARSPNEQGTDARLRASADAVVAATRQATGADNRRKLFKKLALAAKLVAGVSTQLISSAKACSASNRNQASQIQLINACKQVAETSAVLVGGVRIFNDSPDDALAQLKLLNACKGIMMPGGAVVAAAKAAAPTIGDGAAQTQLTNFSKQAAEALRKLKEALDAVESVSGGLEIDSAIGTLQTARGDLNQAKAKAKAGQLRPAADQTVETAQFEVSAASKTIGQSLAQLISAASQGSENYTSVAARDTAQALAILASAVKAVAATSNDRDLQEQAMDSAIEVLNRAERIVELTKKAKTDHADPNFQQQLAVSATDVNKAMSQLVDTLPGYRDVARALAIMQQELARLQSQQAQRAPGETFQTAAAKLSTACTAATLAANGAVNAAKGTPAQLKEAADDLRQKFSTIVTAGLQVVAQANDPAVRADVISNTTAVFTSVSRLLQACKALNTDPTAPNLRNLLPVATKAVNEALQKLVSVGSAAAPGQKECDQANQILDQALSRLEAVNDPNADNEDSYFTSMRKVLEQQSATATAFAQIPAAARSNDPVAMGTAMIQAAEKLTAITDATVRAAFLIAAADSSSAPASAGVIDYAKILMAVGEVEDACQRLQDPNNRQQQVLAAASVIAKSTSALCNYCKAATNKTQNPMAKNQFVASAKAIAGSTGALVADIKSLATTLSFDARAATQRSSMPLMEAMNGLKVYAASPEFAATRGTISPAALRAQAPLVQANQLILHNAKQVVIAVRMLTTNPSDPEAVQLFSSQARGVAEGMRQLVNAFKNGAPGQKECDEAIHIVQDHVAMLDVAVTMAGTGALASQDDGPDFETHKENLINAARAIQSVVDLVGSAAREHPEQLGQVVLQLAETVTPLGFSGVGAASKVEDVVQQGMVLDSAKALCEAVSQYIYAAKAAGGNPDAAPAIAKLDQQKAVAATAVRNLIATLEGSGNETGELNSIIEDVGRAMEAIDDPNEVPNEKPFAAFAQDATYAAGDLANTVTSKARNVDEFPLVASVLGEGYGRLLRAARGAAFAAGDDDIKGNILDAVRSLGGAAMRLIETMKQSIVSPNDPTNRHKVSTTARAFAGTVATLVSALRAGAKGIVACEQAVEAIGNVIGDLDMALVFAAAGQLDPVDKGDHFSNYKQTILDGSRDLTNDAKGLVAGATGTQDQLVVAAQSSVRSIEEIARAMKAAATSMTSADRNGQDQLLNAARTVAVKLQDHVDASMKATSKSAADLNNLRETAKAMVAAISELLKVVKLVGDEATRGVRALDSATDAISAALAHAESSEPAQGSALPDEVIRNAKALASSAAQLVLASAGTQDDIIKNAGQARTVAEDLLRAAKASVADAPKDKQSQMLGAARTAAQSLSLLLAGIKDNVTTPATPASKAKVQASAKSVADSVNKIVQVAGSLVPSDYVDPNDPNVIAERELLAAANSIEAAARKLAALVPAERPRDANEELNFEEQILEAVKAIASASSALVRSATQAQRELMAAGRGMPEEDKQYFSDGTWSDGLVSASRLVAVSTKELCDCANNAVQGGADKPMLIASANAVATSTAQLLSAATVKMDPSSESGQRLRAAGGAVVRATKELVQSAEANIALEDPTKVLENFASLSVVGARRLEIEQKAKLERLRLEFEQAQREYSQIQNAKYAKK